MPTPQQELHTLSHDSLIELFEIDLSPTGINLLDYFCSSTEYLSGEGATLSGQLYKPWPITAQGFESTSEGSLPKPTIEVANIGNTISLLLLLYRPAGATIRRRRIYRKHLDDGDDPNPFAQFEPDEFILDRWDRNDINCTLHLSTELDYLNIEIPTRRMIDLRTGA